VIPSDAFVPSVPPVLASLSAASVPPVPPMFTIPSGSAFSRAQAAIRIKKKGSALLLGLFLAGDFSLTKTMINHKNLATKHLSAKINPICSQALCEPMLQKRIHPVATTVPR